MEHVVDIDVFEVASANDVALGCDMLAGEFGTETGFRNWVHSALSYIIYIPVFFPDVET